ncbi:Flp pilus assembly protein CpaB [Gilvimarinus polysaccharolyticus]|uniref:Flp pilus assembly protein CpaB n=1 Tax=Gilvimarinus polysaccharolyticus TaxID=863921 RepID=UPI0006736C63|nr:Flp pilus assembly protein CpaB [Gilvimarinus polysaccharolyticus]
MKQMSGSRLFMIAIVCGVVAAFLTVYYLKSVEDRYRRANQPQRVETIAVVVPKRDLNKGDTITRDAIGKLDVPKKFLPSNFIPASAYKKVLNRTIASPLKAGRVMTVEAITGTKAETFSETVELGHRAFSVKVNKVDSFDGLLRPGDTIDLMGEFNLENLGFVEGSKQEVNQVVMPVLEKVIVLSAGREDYTGRRYERSRQQNSADGFNMEFTIITLSLTPRQVARVQLAEVTGEMFAVLRHPEDTSMAEFDFIRADVLLEPEPEPLISVVLDENGNPIGRVVGDNVVDANGNIIGKVVDGKPVAFDGTALGSIVENVSKDDPMLRVRERSDVVRDASGNIVGKVEQVVRDKSGKVIGRVVNGELVDANGQVIGRVNADGSVTDSSGRVLGRTEKVVVDKSGKIVGRINKDGAAVSETGELLGVIQKNVALDAQGNVVDLSDSSVPQTRSQVAQVVRDKNGNVVGRIVDGQVIDANGKVVGRVDENGNAVNLRGETLGAVEQVMLDRDGNVVGRMTTIPGTNKKVMVGSDGKVIGSVEDVVRDASGNIIGKVEEVVRDADGNVVGRVVNGKVIDANGNVVGNVNKDGTVTGVNGELLGRVEKAVIDSRGNIVGRINQDGTAVATDGSVLGTVGQAVLNESGQEVGEQVQVVRDANGNIIGRLVDGKVVDEKGNVIGELKDGKVIAADGRVITKGVVVSTENRSDVADEIRESGAAKITREVDYIEFIPGGNDEEGIVPVRRVRLQ